MGLFGKKKDEAPENEELLEEGFDTEELTIQEDAEETEDEDIEEVELDENGEEPEEQVALSPEDRFRDRAANLSKALRMMFPQQMLIGYYYAELQEDGYIDDYCCYATNGELLEKDEIPARLQMTDAEMIAREEKLEQSFFLFRRAAVEYTEKACNGVTVILMNNGQAKLDIVSDDLVEGEEDARYAAFRKKVEIGNPRYQPPRISEETLAAIREKTQDTYKDLGQSFYNFIPGNEFKVAYFYSEFSERGVFYFYRMFLNDDTVLEKEQIFEHFGVDIKEADMRRNEIINHEFAFRNAFVEEKARPFSAISLTITGDGKFTTNLSYGPTDEAGEPERLEMWKKQNNGEGFPPIVRPEKVDLSQKLTAEGIDPEVQSKVNGIYMEIGSEFFSYLPDTEFVRSYMLLEFADEGVFTTTRMILGDGSALEDDEIIEKYGMDESEAEDNRAKIIELIEDIRDMIAEEGETPFTAVTLAISDKGEFRTYMSNDPVDAEDRDQRLEEWKAHYNGGETIG